MNNYYNKAIKDNAVNNLLLKVCLKWHWKQTNIILILKIIPQL